MKDSKELWNFDNFIYLASIPKGEEIKGMTNVDGSLYVCSGRHVYILKDGKRLEKVAGSPL